MLDMNTGSVKRWSSQHEVTSLGPHPEQLFSSEVEVRAGTNAAPGHIGRGEHPQPWRKVSEESTLLTF